MYFAEVEVSLEEESVNVRENANFTYVTVLRSGSTARVDTVSKYILPLTFHLQI